MRRVYVLRDIPIKMGRDERSWGQELLSTKHETYKSMKMGRNESSWDQDLHNMKYETYKSIKMGRDGRSGDQDWQCIISLRSFFTFIFRPLQVRCLSFYAFLRSFSIFFCSLSILFCSTSFCFFCFSNSLYKFCISYANCMVVYSPPGGTAIFGLW